MTYLCRIFGSIFYVQCWLLFVSPGNWSPMAKDIVILLVGLIIINQIFSLVKLLRFVTDRNEPSATDW